jgi:hypothetical protein
MVLPQLILALAGLAADPAAAPPGEQPIIVEGQRPPTFEEALSTVTDITGTVESQLARYSGPVCPTVAGVVPEQAAELEARMRLSAAQVGALVAEAGCEPNLLLAVVPNGAEFLAEMKSKRPNWFEGVSVSEFQRLLREPRVRAWSVTSLVNEDGQRLHKSGSSMQATKQYERQGNQNLASIRQVEVWGPSIFRKSSKYTIDGSAVVIDASATKDLTLRQLADYAVFRGLAKIRMPDDPQRLDSILSIFSGSPANRPRELTRFDRAYLGEMYRNLDGKGFEDAVHERHRIASAIAGRN